MTKKTNAPDFKIIITVLTEKSKISELNLIGLVKTKGILRTAITTFLKQIPQKT